MNSFNANRQDSNMAEKDILEVTREVVADGSLDEKGVETILAAARECSKEKPLTTKERGEVMRIVRDRMKGLTFDKLPTPLRILSIILIASGALGIVAGVWALLPLLNSDFLAKNLSKITATTALVIGLAAACSFISTVLSLVVSRLTTCGLTSGTEDAISSAICWRRVALACMESSATLYVRSWPVSSAMSSSDMKK